tara:strand:- start:2959 stop:4689 length:1731 start_codon:yes stop_codon:yes gene_type:complete
MDEFGSPIAGGIRAVRRSVTSSVFRPVQRQEPVQAEPDPITTNLLSQNSLALTNISQQLQSVSSQISSLNFTLNGVKENLAISDNLERQREAARQNRERILAEQGLREGKESALENKIQSALFSPVQRIAAKTQGVLGNLTSFLFTLAGGWLTMKGIDILQAMSEGNVEKINTLKNQFFVGLTVIVGSFTALSIGVKKVLGILGVFAGNVARVAFGGLLRVGLKGVQTLLAGLVKKAAGLGIAGLFGGGIVKGIGQSILGLGFFQQISDFLKNIFGKEKGAGAGKGSGGFSPSLPINVDKTKKTPPKEGFLKRVTNPVRKRLFPTATDIVARKGTQGAMLNPAKMGLNPLKNTIIKLFNKLPGKNILGKLLGAVGVKGGLKTLFKRLGGPIATFVINLATGDGIGKALASAAGFAAASAATAKLLAPMLALPIPGARILYGILTLAGGIAGEEAIRKLYDGILGIFGFGKKKDKDVNLSKDEKNLPELKETDFTPANANGANSIVPMKNDKMEVADEISKFDEDGSQIVNLSTNRQNNQQSSIQSDPSKDSVTLPNILFDNNNLHTLYATSLTGVS